MRLQNKVAEVTDAASGMGKAIAILQAKAGARVVVSDMNIKATKIAVEEIKSNSGENGDYWVIPVFQVELNEDNRID